MADYELRQIGTGLGYRGSWGSGKKEYSERFAFLLILPKDGMLTHSGNGKMVHNGVTYDIPSAMDVNSYARGTKPVPQNLSAFDFKVAVIDVITDQNGNWDGYDVINDGGVDDDTLHIYMLDAFEGEYPNT